MIAIHRPEIGVMGITAATPAGTAATTMAGGITGTAGWNGITITKCASAAKAGDHDRWDFDPAGFDPLASVHKDDIRD
jgi:hypothetical protein